MQRALRPVLLAALLSLVGGCASSPEVKKASRTMTATLVSMDEAVLAYQQLYLAEIEQTVGELRRAYVSRMVRQRIRGLATEGDRRRRDTRIRDSGLLAMAEEIEQADERARLFVAKVSGLKLREGEEAAAALARLFGTQAVGLREQAKAMRAQGLAAVADELEARAKALEAERPQALEDPRARGYLEAIVHLQAMAAEIPRGLEQLRAVIALLSESHRAVDEWLATDVVPSGKVIGEVFGKHAPNFGFEAPDLPDLPFGNSGAP